jgi:hypothetical protein
MIGRSRRIEEQLELIKTILTLRDPGSPKAAEAYDGLRKAITAATSDRLAHLVHLAQIDAALRRREDPKALALLLRDLMSQAGVDVVDDPTDRELYDVEGSADAAVLQVLEPAYVDTATGRLVRHGRARGRPSSEPLVPGLAAEHKDD